MKLHSASKLYGVPIIPGDKSISHRALLLGSLARGKTEIYHLLEGEDVLSTWRCLTQMGVSIAKVGERTLIRGQGPQNFLASDEALDCGNSGTTMRLLLGILSGLPHAMTLIGDSSLSARPMRRIAEPLRSMGARIELNRNEYAPVHIRGTPSLRAIHYSLPVASAQLKSALLLAGLFAEGETKLTGKIESRDHTERLLPFFGVSLESSPQELSIRGGQILSGNEVKVPGDFSSAAFWIAAATLIPDASIEIQNVSLNPTRTGLLSVLSRMGARIATEVTTSLPEPCGRLHVRSAPLQATTILENEVPTLIDELPILAILAARAEGQTRIHGVGELKVKETDRLQAIVCNLKAMGVVTESQGNDLFITGPQSFRGGRIESYGDHRIAMSFSIAALIAQGATEVLGSECVRISYPEFYSTLQKLTQVRS